jgi:hypothetical protein
VSLKVSDAFPSHLIQAGFEHEKMSVQKSKISEWKIIKIEKQMIGVVSLNENYAPLPLSLESEMEKAYFY